MSLLRNPREHCLTEGNQEDGNCAFGCSNKIDCEIAASESQLNFMHLILFGVEGLAFKFLGDDDVLKVKKLL